MIWLASVLMSLALHVFLLSLLAIKLLVVEVVVVVSITGITVSIYWLLK